MFESLFQISWQKGWRNAKTIWQNFDASRICSQIVKNSPAMKGNKSREILCNCVLAKFKDFWRHLKFFIGRLFDIFLTIFNKLTTLNNILMPFRHILMTFESCNLSNLILTNIVKILSKLSSKCCQFAIHIQSKRACIEVRIKTLAKTQTYWVDMANVCPRYQPGRIHATTSMIVTLILAWSVTYSMAILLLFNPSIGFSSEMHAQRK